jgi:hypothetical protein
VLTAFLLAALAIGVLIVLELSRTRRDANTARLLSVFGPAIARVRKDPRALLVWEPLARTARRVFPEAFAALERNGGTFPFTIAEIREAHDRWTGEWLTWERNHELEYRLKAAAAEEQLSRGDRGAALRQAEALEREKLDRYQRRYEEYIRVAKALQALAGDGADLTAPRR